MTWEHAVAWVICFLGATASQIPLHQHEHKQGKHGAVASENRLCTQIGIDLLNAGGNAADAVISSPTLGLNLKLLMCLQMVGTTFCVGVISMD